MTVGQAAVQTGQARLAYHLAVERGHGLDAGDGDAAALRQPQVARQQHQVRQHAHPIHAQLVPPQTLIEAHGPQVNPEPNPSRPLLARLQPDDPYDRGCGDGCGSDLREAALGVRTDVAQLLLLRRLGPLGELLQRLEVACRNTTSD